MPSVVRTVAFMVLLPPKETGITPIWKLSAADARSMLVAVVGVVMPSVISSDPEMGNSASVRLSDTDAIEILVSMSIRARQWVKVRVSVISMVPPSAASGSLPSV